MKKLHLTLVALIGLFSCSGNDTIAPEQQSANYYPQITGNEWETVSANDLSWNENAVAPLLNFLEEKNTKAFIILVDGKIVLENYFNGHTASQNWYWASAGKTLTSTMVGIAEQEGILNINNKVSDYLGTGWTSEQLEQENLITNFHLLTMTSGIDDTAVEECVTPDCLLYNSDAGSRWAYHNVFVKLQDVVASASGQSFTSYFNSKLRDKIGMDGNWFTSGNNIVYSSTARSMARFGLLIQRDGIWENNIIINPQFLGDATSTSQNINLAYGYLWWLNGKSSYHLPQSQFEFSGSIIPSAPADIFMALGKNDQKLYIVPSKKMVIVRMGEAADDVSMALSTFDNELWIKINAVIE